jgi:HD-like signal output (HDOD) protein
MAELAKIQNVTGDILNDLNEALNESPPGPNSATEILDLRFAVG